MPGRPYGKPFQDQLHRRIARVCAEDPLGAYAIARELGLPTKKIASPLKTMEESGLLRVEHADGDSRSKLYQLKPELMEDLLAAAAQAREPGLLRDGQRLLVVSVDDPNVIARALHPRDLAAALAWSARVTGSRAATYLLAFNPEAGALVVDGAIEKLLRTGATIESVAIDEVVDPQDFQEWGKLMRYRDRQARVPVPVPKS